MGNIGFRCPPPTSIHALGRGGGYALVAKSCLILATPWTVARQAPLSMGFSRQETGHSCYFLLQGIFPIEGLNVSPALVGGFFTMEPPGKTNHRLDMALKSHFVFQVV